MYFAAVLIDCHRKTNVRVREKNTFFQKCPQYTEKTVEKCRIIHYDKDIQ